VQAQLSLNEKCKELEETIQRVATNSIGYTRKQAKKEWFDEACAKVNEKKNVAREIAIQIKTGGAKNAYKLLPLGLALNRAFCGRSSGLPIM
jgi:hypothetical protein